ncbi:MAG: 5'-methylthioadenosine/S-adenosylhomocysteine nucleosidase [Chloroflexota bacterium]
MNTSNSSQPPIIVLISANIEWRAIRKLFPNVTIQHSPYGEWFTTDLALPTSKNNLSVYFFHGGWGKIAAAGSTQYVIDRWQPELLINLGTCGGFEGHIQRNEVILVDKTIVYDIIEQMGDYDEHIAHYTTVLDLSWLPADVPQSVRRTLLVSGDRDLLPEDIHHLASKFGAVAGDWESGAIAFVASRNQVRLIILRGVTDLVGAQGGEAYGNLQFFEQATLKIMQNLTNHLPAWLQIASHES